MFQAQFAENLASGPRSAISGDGGAGPGGTRLTRSCYVGSIRGVGSEKQIPIADLYWIAVSPAAQGKGVGKKLVAFMEDTLEDRRARKVMIETSSTPVCDPTRAFYLRLGYHEAARIADFYKPGDAKVIYARDLG